MKLKGLFALLSPVFILLIFSCTKVNEATQLGDDLIPAVDNINTFDTTISVDAAYHPFDDTSKHYISDNMALGRINDPLFGTANADMYFNLSSGASGTSYGSYPFGADKNSVEGIDSVVLSLSYQGAYGDTVSLGSTLTVQVYEIAPGTGFNDDSIYRFNTTGFNTNPSPLGTKTFSVTTLDDSLAVRRKGDSTTKVANVLRIPLSNSIGLKLMSFDTTSNAATGGYSSDSVFRKLFRGLAVKTTSASGKGAFAYFNLYDVTKTQLIVYYRQKTTTGTVDSAASAVFVHSRYGQANSIIRNPGGQYLANIDKPASQLFYLQSSPSGSYVGIKVPNFEAFPNRVIHRAELIANQVGDPDNVYFTVPNLLFLDHKGPYGGTATDTAYFFEKDISTNSTGNFDYSTFGGKIKSDNAYHFNITRYIQGLVTLKGRNDSLRLYAPVRAYDYEPSTKLLLAYPYNNILDNPAKGRAVIAGPKYADATKRLRLRIVYSNL